MNTSRAARLLNTRPRTLLFWKLSLVLNGALIFASVWRWGAVELRGHAEEAVPITIIGMFLLPVSARGLAWLGLSVDLDLIEGRNWSAAFAISATSLAISVIFAGGNVGEGPSYGNNVFSVFVGSVAFVVLLIVFQLGSQIFFSITEERDLASGIRFSGVVLAIGLILGRAIAGNWESEFGTLRDLARDGWPAGAMCGLGIVVEPLFRPSRSRPFPSVFGCGVIPGLAFFGSAIAWLVHLGRWEGMP